MTDSLTPVIDTIEYLAKKSTSILGIISDVTGSFVGTKTIAETLGLIDSATARIEKELTEIGVKLDNMENLLQQILQYLHDQEKKDIINSLKTNMLDIELQSRIWIDNLLFQLDSAAKKSHEKPHELTDPYEQFKSDLFSAMRISNRDVETKLYNAFIDLCKAFELDPLTKREKENAMTIVDEWTANTFNWENDARDWRKGFRDLLYSYLNLGCNMLCLKEMSFSRGTGGLIELRDHVIKIVEGHKLELSNTPEADKSRYSLVNHTVIRGIRKINGKDLYLQRGHIGNLYVPQVAKMAARAKQCSRNLIDELIQNEIIAEGDRHFVEVHYLIVEPGRVCGTSLDYGVVAHAFENLKVFEGAVNPPCNLVKLFADTKVAARKHSSFNKEAFYFIGG